MTADECRNIARRYFAVAIACDDDQIRERLLAKGEAWMANWRFWSDSMSFLAAPEPEREARPSPVRPWRVE
jgi:hypothetical protein